VSIVVDPTHSEETFEQFKKSLTLLDADMLVDLKKDIVLERDHEECAFTRRLRDEEIQAVEFEIKARKIF
jgi:hypothetical protein